MFFICRATRESVSPSSSCWFWTQKRGMRRKVAPPGKPPILPPSKTRLYQIERVKWMAPELVTDLLWRRHVYNNAILSMRQLFREEYEQKQAGITFGFQQLVNQGRDELDRLLAENEERNRQNARKRAELEEEEAKRLYEETLRETEEQMKKTEQEIRERSTEVMDMIERSKDFITEENLKEKIMEALENPVTFDYAIDLSGTNITNPLPTKYLQDAISTQKQGRFYDTATGFGLQKAGTAKISPRGGILSMKRGKNQKERRNGEVPKPDEKK